MEPERKIEKLLRSAAKKRRSEGGDSFDLHPATRRMLQGEVARRFPKQHGTGGGFFARVFGRMRPSRVFALCFVASLLVSAVLILPTLSVAKKKSVALASFDGDKRSGPSARTLDKDSESRPEIPAPASAPPVVAANKPTISSEPLQSNSVREETKKEALQTDSLAGAGVEKLAMNDAVKTQRRKDGSAATGTVASAPTFGAPPASTSGAAVAASPPPLDKLHGALPPPLESATQRFSQADLSLNMQDGFKKSVPPGKIVPVLVNFELQQNGSKVAVVDEDGSVYTGYVVAGDIAKESAPAKALTRSAAQTKTAEPESVNASQKQANEAAQNYFFRVAGTNRSLKQNVVFTGNVINESNAGPQQYGAAPGSPTGAASNRALYQNQVQQMLKKGAQQSLFSNSRIAGTAVIGTTNQIEINAVPLPQ